MIQDSNIIHFLTDNFSRTHNDTTPEIINITRLGLQKRLFIRLTGNIIVQHSELTPPKFVASGFIGKLIDKIDFSPKNLLLKSIPAKTLIMLDSYDFDGNFPVVEPSGDITSGESYAFSAVLTLHFDLQHKNYLSNSRKFSRLFINTKTNELKIYPNAAANVIDGAFTSAITNFSVELLCDEGNEPITPTAVNKQIYKIVNWVGSNDKLIIQSLTEPTTIKQIMLRFSDNGVDADNLLSKLKVVVNDNTTIIQLTAAQIKDLNYKTFDKANDTGVYFLTFDNEHTLAQFLQIGTTYKKVEIQAEVNAATVGKIEILLDELYPVKQFFA